MYQGGLQQPGTTVVVVQQPRYGNAPWVSRAPVYLRNGLQMGGIMISAHLIFCLGVFGVFLTFGGILFMATDADAEFWAKFNRTHGPATVAGAIFLVVGLCLIVACIVLACFGKKKYKAMRQQNQDNPGRVINPNPGTYPAGEVPPYGMNPGAQVAPYPPGGINNSPMGGYPAGQPPPYPDPVPREASRPVDYEVKPYPFPEASGNPSDSHKSGANEYDNPPPYAPDYKGGI